MPALAETLTRCGVKVVTGPDFRSAAKAIRTELTTSGAFPMVVADIPAPGLRAWIERVQETAEMQGAPIAVTVLRNAGNPVLVSANVSDISEPFTVNQLLGSLKLQGLDGPAGNTLYPESAGSPAPGLAMPEFDDLLGDDEFAAPILTPETVTKSEFDDWDAPEKPVSPISSVNAEPAAPISDDWDSFAPALAPLPAPADVLGWDEPAPSPAAPAAPVDDWDTPAAPVPAPAPRMEPADDWDTPTPAAPVPAQPLSRREARALAASPATDDWDTPTPAPVQPAYRAPEPAAYAAPAPPAAYQPAPASYQAPVPAPVQPAWEQELSPIEAAPVPAARPGALAVPAGREVSDAWAAERRPVHDLSRVEDSSAIFDDFEASKLAGTGRSAAGLASFVINFSGKGGVGKSTTSLQMAHVAAAAGLRVILIDGNSGQGDLRTYLRLNRTSLPTIYDAAIKNIRSAVLTPDVINQNREDILGHVNFAFIAAPPDDINDPSVVTNQLYADVIAFARRNADLVIMDTQIIETSDRTGVVSQILLPALVHDAWGLGVTDMSNTGVNNLNGRLRTFIKNGVPQDRLMVMVNKVDPEQEPVAATMPRYFSSSGYYLGTIATDLDVQQDMNAGRINIGSQDLRTLMSKALLRITGNEAFRADAEYTPEAAAPRGFFAKVFGKK
nr:AAA family ATPase [Arthrobacter caoxuetaonis]